MGRRVAPILLAVGMVAGVIPAWGEGDQEPAPASRPSTTQAARSPKPVPWIEVASSVPGSVDGAVAGLLIWRGTTDTAIVSVDPGDTDAVRTIRARVPGMRIIPGVKTSPALGHDSFDLVSGWREIGQAVRRMCEQTGSRVYALENESAINPYLAGKYEPNWDRLREGLRQLPADCQVLWYPSVIGSGDIEERSERMCKVVQEVLDVRFVETSKFYNPYSLDAKATQSNIRKIEALAKLPRVSAIYCCGERYWPIERVPELIEMAQGDIVIVYPGAARWVEAARTIGELRALRTPPERKPAVP